MVTPQTQHTAEPTQTGVLPLLLGGAEVCRLLGVSLSTLYAMDRSGELGPGGVKLRGRRLWRRDEVTAWVRNDCPRREVWEALWADLRHEPQAA